MSDPVCVKTYLTRQEAEMDGAFLVGCGIPVRIAAHDAAGMLPFPVSGKTGVELLVPQDRAAEARALLESPPESE